MSLKGLVDRERELAALRALVDAATAGRGGLVLVEGPAGIGKTRLLAAAREVAEERGLEVLRACGSELERDFPFGAVRQLLEPPLAALTEEERASLFEGSAAHALALFSQADARPAGDPDYATLHGLYWLLVGLSQRAPLLVVVDDVHWVDAPSLRFLGFLARRMDGMCLLLCGALRPAEPGTDRALLSDLALVAEALQPGPLSAGGAAELIGAQLGATPQPAFVQECIDATGGNPFYLHALTRELAQRGPGARIGELGSEGVSRLLLRRLAALGVGAPELANALAILGDGATLGEIARHAGLEPHAAATAADALARAAIAEGAERLAFVHPIVRASIYGEVPPAVRAGLHRRAAHQLAEHGADLDRVAAQLLLAGPPDAWAVERLREAAARALQRGAPESAAEYTRRALDGQDDPGLRIALLQELAGAEAAQLDVAAIGHLQEAMALSADSLLRARIAFSLVQLVLYAGEWDAAVALSQSALEELGERDGELALRLRTYQAAAATYDPRLVEAFEPQLDELHRQALAGGAAGRPLALLLAASRAHRGERIDEVVGLVEHGLDGGRLLAEEHGDAWPFPEAMMALVGIDELDRAERLDDELLADARARGSMRGFVVAIAVRVQVRAFRGDLNGTEADVRTGIALAQEHGMLFGLASMLRWGMDAMLERPDLADVAAFAESLELPPGLASTVSGGWMHEVRGNVRLQAGDRAAAVDALRRAGEIFEALRFRNTGAYAWRSALALATGDPGEARALARAELEDARRVGLARGIGVATRTLGLVEGDRALLREAVAVLAGSPAVLELARTQVELGAALRRANQRAEAREPLRAGLDLAQRCGATRLAERARSELRATGARPRREALTGRAALTASERRTAEMAAAGMSNPAIAQALFVTVKTVEGHLSGAYRKLDVRSRAELPKALEG